MPFRRKILPLLPRRSPACWKTIHSVHAWDIKAASFFFVASRPVGWSMALKRYTVWLPDDSSAATTDVVTAHFVILPEECHPERSEGSSRLTDGAPSLHFVPPRTTYTAKLGRCNPRFSVVFCDAILYIIALTSIFQLNVPLKR